jgi:spore germination protein YaaH
MSPRIAALLVGGVLGLVVLVAVGANLLAGSMSPAASLGASANPSASVNPSEIAANPSQSPTATESPDASPTPYPTPSGPPRKRALADREIFGFLPYWKLGLPDTQLPMDQLTTVAIFGVEAGKDGKLVTQTASGATPQGWTAWKSAATDDIIRKAHAAGVRVALTIQRFSWSTGQARKTVALLSDPQNRSTLATQIATEVTNRRADGVNLDFEPLPTGLRDDFTSFVRELRVQLDHAKAGLQLTFDTTVDVSGWDLPALTADDAADAAIILGYDYRVATAAVAGSVDPLVSASFGGGLLDTLDATLAQISPDRVILGLPWYGRAWSTFSDQAGSATLNQKTYGDSVTTEYGDAIALARLHGRNYDVQEASAWTAYRKKDCATCPQTWRQLWYDDVDSMQAKQKLIVGRGMRGLGIWVLGYDHALPDLWATVRFSFAGRTDALAPTGTAKVDPQAITQRHGTLPVVDGTLALNLTADDGNNGSGVAFVRVSTATDLYVNGNLANSITYPWDASAPSLSLALSDQRFGNGFAKGQATVFVQWRDIAGNWSSAVSVAFWLPTAVSPAPSPLP